LHTICTQGEEGKECNTTFTHTTHTTFSHTTFSHTSHTTFPHATHTTHATHHTPSLTPLILLPSPTQGEEGKEFYVVASGNFEVRLQSTDASTDASAGAEGGWKEDGGNVVHSYSAGEAECLQ
jgi:hypothetical protein